MNSTNREKLQLLFVLVTAASVLFIGEMISSSIVKSSGGNSVYHRPDDVIILPNRPEALPSPDPTKAAMILIGNSHTYALPSLEKGYPLGPDTGATLIDELASDIKKQKANYKVNYYRLSYPNFLPFEMLTSVFNLFYRHYQPKVVVLGLTWRNIARDTELRDEIFQTYKDKEFVVSFKRMLQNPAVSSSKEILRAIEDEERISQFGEEKERTRSYTDRLDEKITERVGDKLTLLGSSAELRARIFRQFNYGIIAKLTSNADNAPQYDVIESDLKFNLKCLEALVKLLRSQGTEVVFYYAPERTDLQALIDKTEQEKVMGEFKQFAGSQGCTVLDARNVVPNEYWGWDYNIPDRSHFTEAGHKLLAQFIAAEGEKRKLWEALLTP